MLNLRPEWKPIACYFKERVPYIIQKNGKIKMQYELVGKIDNWDNVLYMNMPCKRCLYCVSKESTDWAVRLMLEAQLYPQNACFVTFTYNEENLPKDEFLKKEDYQKLMKRMRQQYGELRYFIAGEYGGGNLRQHFHVAFFGYVPKDLVYYGKDKKAILYTSKSLEKIWGKGHTKIITEMNVQTMKYIAKYLTKIRELPEAYKYNPEFICMSLKPAIADEAYDKKVWENGCVYLGGSKYAIPKRWEVLAERQGHTKEMKLFKEKQLKKAKDSELIGNELSKQQYNYLTLPIVKGGAPALGFMEGIGTSHLYDKRDLDKERKIKELEEMVRRMETDKKIKN